MTPFQLILASAILVVAASASNNLTTSYEPKTMITSPNTIKADCQSHCGNLKVPYPFGIGSGCALNSTFEIICNSSHNPPLAISLAAASPDVYPLVVLNISESELRVQSCIVFTCLDTLELPDNIAFIPIIVESGPLKYPFPLSPTANKFVAIGGCRDSVLFNLMEQGISGGSDASSVAECSPSCNNDQGGCGGNGCCQTAIPRGLSNFTIKGQYMSIVLESPNKPPCSYAFVGERDRFHYMGTSDIDDPDAFIGRLNFSSIPLVLDWAIGNENCSTARMNRTSYACQHNAVCTDAVADTGNSRGGYHCSCLLGFEGNPYLPPAGCTDINECADPNSNSCSNICTNTEGSYKCSCPPGYTGDAKKNGSGCVRIQTITPFPMVRLVLGLSSGLLFLILGGIWIFFAQKKRKHMKVKEKYFEQNGGLFLKQILSSSDSSSLDTTKIFSIEELKTATSNFSEDNIIGRGGQGIVYKGILPNNQVSAIKKARVPDEDQVQEFTNEVILLTRINHRNVVKLLGCCLETKFPMLVYEFISNGTLYDHIHAAGGGAYWLCWPNVLRIGIEVANALAYLHSAASVPIIHRDIKSKNILLDESHTAKVSDFGASRLIPLNQTQLSTKVQGTRGYLDPEYRFSGQLTEKSDVYSFGVVLAELLTRQEPFDRTRPHENLGDMFIISMAEGHVFDILDAQLAKDAPREPLMAIAEVVVKCISTRREDRPTMKEVATELECLRTPSTDHDEQENQRCDEERDLYPVFLESYARNTCPFSLQVEMKDEMMHPR
ncbi:hypothetical protein Droror1_Dr00025795 [Drosera rotundifolia]